MRRDGGRWRPRASCRCTRRAGRGCTRQRSASTNAPVRAAPVAAQFEASTSAADPVEDATSTHERSAEHHADRLLGARRPDLRHRFGLHQLRPGLPGQVRLSGHLQRLPRARRLQPARPATGRSTTRAAPRARATSSSTRTSSCARGTRRSPPAAPRPSPAAARSSAQGFEGIHIFDISNPEAPIVRARPAAAPRPATRPARRPAAARTRRAPCRTRRAATCTSTTAAPAAPARASRSSRSSSRTRPTPSRCDARTRSASATTTRS